MPLGRRLGSLSVQLAALFAVMGPGIITSNVDNDAGGIYTYSVAGARYGYSLLWLMVPVLVALIVVQEMCARMGAVTGKGLADLIREQFGLRLTAILMLALLVTNLANAVAEFAGLASSLELFGVSRYVSVPAGAVTVWWLIVFGTYRSVEKAFLVACVLYLAYPVSGLLARPDWAAVAWGSIVPRAPLTLDGVAMMVGIIGTTIAPWMQFYLQSSVVEKEVKISDYAKSWFDVVLGSIFAVLVAAFIVIACAATLHVAGTTDIRDAADAARALAPLAGRYAWALFALGLANASLFAASILPLATAYSVCEGLGLEAGVNRTFGEAPEFYWLYTLIIVVSAGAILVPGVPLLQIILFSQVMNGVLLPFVLVLMVLLINQHGLMGTFVNGRAYNLVAWATTVALIVLTVAMVVTAFLA
ncbi:MAG TPA: Nramp family divalent metal transporter [Methylomirabilota bacterium]|nr:Nramp family divalent metal transporter [Methylomirabilota bacterium]